jgi:hypothetical protein
MSSALINDYVAGLHRRLPAAVADEAADGLIETYEHHLAARSGEQAAAHAAVAEFGDLALVVGEFTRQAPGRRAARMLLATGPVVGACWAAALILSRAWTWPVPGAVRLSFGATLLLAVMTLAVAATQPAKLPADHVHHCRQPGHPRPGRHSSRRRHARRTGPDLGAGNRRRRQPHPDGLHRLVAAPHRQLTGAHITPPQWLARRSTAAITTRRPGGPPADRLDRVISQDPRTGGSARTRPSERHNSRPYGIGDLAQPQGGAG